MLPKNLSRSLVCLHAWLPLLSAIYSLDAVALIMSFSVCALQWNNAPFRYRIYALVLCLVSGCPARSISVGKLRLAVLPCVCSLVIDPHHQCA